MGDPTWQNPKWSVPADGEDEAIASLVPYAEMLTRGAIPGAEKNMFYHEFLSNILLVLVKAVREFDPNRGPNLRKHAMYRMRGEVIQCFRRSYVQDTFKNVSLDAIMYVNDTAHRRKETYASIITAKSNGVGPTELLEKLKKYLSPREYLIAKMRVEGYAMQEIADKIGRAKTTTEAAMRGLRVKIADLLKLH